MTYNYDPELAAALEFLPEGGLDLEDLAATRLGFMAMIKPMNADLDCSGVEVDWGGERARASCLSLASRVVRKERN